VPLFFRESDAQFPVASLKAAEFRSEWETASLRAWRSRREMQMVWESEILFCALISASSPDLEIESAKLFSFLAKALAMELAKSSSALARPKETGSASVFLQTVSGVFVLDSALELVGRFF
jgi:hypothetical protein